MFQMASYVVINDNTLRQRLRQFRFKPDGPITDTTRDVYVRKLQQLERAARRGQSSALASATPAQASVMPSVQSEQFAPRTFNLHQPPSNFTSNATPHTRSTLSANSSPRLAALQINHHQNELVARSAPSEDTNRSSTIIHGEYNSEHCSVSV